MVTPHIPTIERVMYSKNLFFILLNKLVLLGFMMSRK